VMGWCHALGFLDHTPPTYTTLGNRADSPAV